MFIKIFRRNVLSHFNIILEITVSLTFLVFYIKIFCYCILSHHTMVSKYKKVAKQTCCYCSKSFVRMRRHLIQNMDCNNKWLNHLSQSNSTPVLAPQCNILPDSLNSSIWFRTTQYILFDHK